MFRKATSREDGTRRQTVARTCEVTSILSIIAHDIAERSPSLLACLSLELIALTCVIFFSLCEADPSTAAVPRRLYRRRRGCGATGHIVVPSGIQ